MRRSISSRLVWLWSNRANMMNGTFLASILALGTSHSVYGQCPPEEPPLAPILETFDGYTNGGIATLPNCWTMSPVSTSTSSQGWRIEDATTVSGSTGPNVDNTLGTTAGKYIHLETSGGATGALSSFETSDISLDNLGPNRQLSFYYHMYGATIGTLTVEVFDGTSYNSVFTLTGQQQTSGADPWQQANVSLASYSGVVRIRFSGTRGTNFTGDMAIDDVSIDNPPACSAVSNPITSNLTSSSVDVSWTAGDPSATQWQVEYGAPGFAAGSGTILPVTGSPTAALTGLAPNTTYSILIREACVASPGSFSPDVATIITTLCAPVATWTENWDSHPTGSTVTTWGCTSKVGTSGSAYVSASTNAPSQPNYFYFYGTTTAYPTLLLPEVTNAQAGTHRLEMLARSTSTANTWINIGYLTDVNDANSFVATDSVEVPYTSTSTVFNAVNFTPGAIPAGTRLALQHSGKNSSTVYFDDMAWVAIPTCEPVTAMSSTGATASSLDLSWSHTFGNAQDFNLEYGVSGFTPGTGTPANAISGTSTTISGLMDNTTYDVYIQVNCGATDGLSTWERPFSFTTACAETTTWSEDFEAYASGARPDCWGIVSIQGSFNVSTTTPATGLRSFYLYYSTSYTTPLVGTIKPVSNLGDGTHQLRFQGRSGSTTLNPILELGYVTNPFDANSFVSLGSATLVGTSMTEYIILPSTTAVPAGAVMAFRRAAVTTSAYIDDVVWEAIPSCPPVIGMSANASSTTTAMATWSTGGSETAWEWAVVAAGSAAPTSGASITDTFATATGLTYGQAYDFYVRAACGPGDLSPWRVANFSLAYCASNSTNTADSKVGLVAVGSDTVVAATACASYTDNTGLAPFSLQFAVPTQVVVGYYSCSGSNYGSYAKVFVDFNDDLSFDASEVIAEGNASTALVANASMPASGIVGLHRMRVVLRESGSTTTTVSCGTYSYGETQDFMVDVAAAPACAPPTGIAAVATLYDQVTLAWNSNETSFEIEVGASGFTPTGVATATVTDTFAVVTGLTASTAYQYYVRTICGASSSPWLGPFSFLTPCSPSALPYTESFDTWPPACWDIDNGAAIPVHFGNDYMEGSFWGWNDISAYAYSQSVNIDVDARVKFRWSHLYSTAYPNDQVVLLARIQGSASWDTIVNLIGPSFSSPGAGTTAPSADADFVQEIHNLDPSYTGNVAEFRLDLNSDYGPDVFIDDFIVEAVPACAEPLGVTTSPIFGYQATISWNSSDSNFEIELDSAGFTPTGVATTTATDTFAVVTGLSPSTAYQYYVRTVCGGDYSVWTGPYSFTTTVSCPAPTFASGTASPTAVTFSWTSNGLATDYNYAVIHQDSTLKAADILSTQALTATVTGLSDNTPYTIYLRDSCGAGDVSSWVTVNYVSPCNAQVAPYVQAFDAWPTNTQGLFDCWSIQAGQNVTGPPYWRSNIGATGSSGTGPISGNGGSGGYIFLETSVTNNDIAYSFSPFVDINSLTSPELTFFYHMYGATMGTLTVDVWNGASWVNVWDTTGQIQTSDVAPWNKKSISLAAFSDTIQVRFGGTRNGDFTGDMAIDDFRIDEVPACNSPSNLANSYLTGDTAIFVWNAGDAAATSWNVEYGPTGFSIGSGTSMTVTDTFAVLGGLTDRTIYDIYVSEKCVSNAGYSLTVTTSFTTACPAFITAPYLEDFSTAKITPFSSDFNNCWTTNAATTSVLRWEAEDATGVNENSTATGPFWDNTSFGVVGGIYMYLETSSGSAGSTSELYAPTVDVSGLSNPVLTFYYHMYGATTGTLEVQVSDDGGATWTSAWSLSGQQQTAGGDPWTQAIVSLGGYGNMVDVKFIGTRGSSFDGDISIDDVSYEEGPACFPPTSLTATTTSTTATLSWNPADVNATTWFVEYGAQGFTQGSGTSVTVTDTFAAITGLSSQTTYDYYVIEQCAGTTDSSAAASSAFTTGITVPYFEGFDGGYSPAGWTEAQGNIANPTVLTGTTSGWSSDTWLNGAAGNNAMGENLYSTADDEWSFTPPIEIPAGIDVELSFDIAVLAWNSTTTPGVLDADDSVMVVISMDGTWNRSNAVYVLHAGNQFSGTDANIAVDISAYAGSTIQIGFYDESTVSGSDLDVMFDNISVTEICEEYNASAEEIGNYRVRFKWDDMGAASGYTLNLREVGGSTWSSFFTTDTFRVLDNRAPGDYEFYVSSVDLPNACSVSNVTVSCADDIVFTYNAFQAPELGRYGRVRVFGTQGGKRLYDIYLVNSAGDTTASTNVRQRNYTDLPADSYMIYVTDDFGCAADSVGQFTINSMDTAWIPNLINAPNNSPNGFRPTWNSVGGVINYQLRVLNVTDGTLQSFITGITDTMRAVTGLAPGKLYRFNVRSRYNNGVATVNSGYSNPVSRNLPAGGNKEGEASDIAENAAELISIYPNPVADVLFVSAPTASEVALLDMSGKVIAVRSLNGQEVSFDMSSLAGGVYMVRITNADYVTIQKVVKQ